MPAEIIAALSTPLMQSAIALLRLSGEGVCEEINDFISYDITKQKANTIEYGHIVQGNTKVDEVLISVFKAPHSFTREDMVEINCHGGIYVARRVLSLLLSKNIRLALPGEFTRRAFLNGRIDLTQAEAVLDLIEAKSEEARSGAMASLQGEARLLLEPLIEEISQAIAAIEVHIDYPEYEDTEPTSQKAFETKLLDWISRSEGLLRQANQSRYIYQGIKTAIIGEPNVGKSSLFNALLKQDKAIVTDIAGTTRDVVEGQVNLDGIILHLLDTAGIHKTVDAIEQIGISKSEAVMAEADLIILLLDPFAPQDYKEYQDKYQDRLLVVTNKKDLKAVDGLCISAKNGEIDDLVNAIHQHFDIKGLTASQTLLHNERQIGLLTRAHEALKSALKNSEENQPSDLVVIDLNEAASAWAELLGRVHREDLLDRIFSRFCVGK
ncbi:MAG: tRNA uridine-5-carboxymethylaminomethyl(34) synthesis GTPase MnmE [Erysipelotrichaceae bacterium]|jgi:tRNA modification GTPase|nr:tRNA uridine-5-carboxymethylaminomethyl(34) synthesis GTPase MnmE [Erysipelotrichaceae bacterium]